MNHAVDKKTLLQSLELVQKVAEKSKFGRFISMPISYSTAILHRLLLYPITQIELIKRKKVFFGEEMSLSLPSSTDIFLTGGKSHDSEIRLAKLMILTLTPSMRVLDIGAHIGYFSLLMAKLIGTEGKVFAFEPASGSREILIKNTQHHSNIKTFAVALSDTSGYQKFYEFPSKYAEYNSFDVEQYKDEIWFADSGVETITVQTSMLDGFIEEIGGYPDFIKMDVEGAENQVIKGGQRLFSDGSPIIVMEFLSQKRKNKAHHEAANLLKSMGYLPHIIQTDGTTSECENIDLHFEKQGIDSDNLVFKKS